MQKIAEFSHFDETKNPDWFLVVFKVKSSLKGDTAHIDVFERMLVSSDEKAKLEQEMAELKKQGAKKYTMLALLKGTGEKS